MFELVEKKKRTRWADSGFFLLCLDEHLPSVLPGEISGHRFRQGWFSRFFFFEFQFFGPGSRIVSIVYDWRAILFSRSRNTFAIFGLKRLSI